MTTETMTANVQLARSDSTAATFLDTLRSEFDKIASLRSSRVALGLGFGLSVGTAVVASTVLGAMDREWPSNPITFSLVVTIFSLLIYSVFGVMTMASEYSSGMSRLTLTATPNRHRVFLAKLILITAIVAGFGVVTTISMFLVTQVVMGAYGLPVVSLAEGDSLRAVIGLGLVMPFYPLIGFALGTLLRSTAAAITAVMGLLWLPQILSEFLLPSTWSNNIVSLLPSSALDSVTVSHIASSPAYSDPAVGAVIAAGWLAVFVGSAYIAFRRRDV